MCLLLDAYIKFIYNIITLLWNNYSEEVAALNPIRLKAGDVITMGSTELLVHISSFEEQENSNKEITSY